MNYNLSDFSLASLLKYFFDVVDGMCGFLRQRCTL